MGGMNAGGGQSGSLFPGRADREHLATLTPYIDLLGTYDLTNALPTTNTAAVQDYSASGIAGVAGLDGYHSWERTTIGITARGNYRHYMNGQIPDSNNEYLAFGLEHRISRQTSFSLSETAGSSTNAVSGALFGLGSASILPGLGEVDRNLASIPTNELFDNRVYYSSTSAQLGYQRTARLNLFGGGGAFIIRRKVNNAPGSNGGSGYAGMSYMLSRRQSIGVQYSFIKYDYTQQYGHADIHLAGLGYSVILNRNWDFHVQGGVYRASLLQPIRVSLDPAVAQLLGQTSTTQIYKGASYRGQGSVLLNGSFRRSSVNLSYYRTTGAGNSVFLTSQVDGVMSTYSYQLKRRCSVMIGGFYLHQTDLSGNYNSLNQYGGISSFFYRVMDSLHVMANVGTRHVNLNGPNYRPNSMTASVGFGYSPTRGLPLW